MAITRARKCRRCRYSKAHTLFPAVLCTKGHKPRLYKRTDGVQAEEYKRVCEDFKGVDYDRKTITM